AGCSTILGAHFWLILFNCFSKHSIGAATGTNFSQRVSININFSSSSRIEAECADSVKWRPTFAGLSHLAIVCFLSHSPRGRLDLCTPPNSNVRRDTWRLCSPRAIPLLHSVADF